MSENKAITEAEVIEENEVETFPEATGVVGGALGIEDQLALAENIGKLVDAQNKIRMTLLRLAQSGDWVIFGDGEKAKAELNFAGAMRIGSTLGCSFTNWSAQKETGADEKGSWYRWDYECDAVFRGRSIRVYGRAASRDKFFGKAHGEYKALADVDEGNIRQAARRGAMKEGVKVLFGMHHMDPKELEKVGIKMDSTTDVSFKSAETKSEEAQTATVAVQDVRVKKGDNWTKYTIIDVEGVSYSTFSESLATVAKEAKASGKHVTITFVRGKFGPEIKGIANV